MMPLASLVLLTGRASTSTIAGKDTIVFNAQMSGIAAGYDAEYNTLVLSSLSESNLSAMDLVVAQSGGAAVSVGSGASS